jgi:hypothetical protein
VFLAAGALLALFEAARALLLKLPGAGLLGGGILLAAAFPAVLALSRAAGGAPAWVFASVIFLGTVVLLLAFSAHLGRVHAGVVTELEVLNRGLEAKVAARTSELEEANARIASLSGRAREAAEDLEAWTRAMAVELAPALGAATLELWALGRDGASALTANPTLPLSADSVRSLAQKPVSFEDSADLIVPVLGLRGEPIGALVVRGRAAPWTATQTQLLQSLSSHLAGALDLRRLKLEALEAEARALASRQDLIDQGLEVLHTCPACGRCYPHTVAACTEDGLPLEPARAIAYRAGGRYRLVRILGRGAMGLVFEARDEELDRFVALKVILPEHFSQPEYRQRFEQEAWALARMNHPGILAVHDRGSLPDGSGFIVTERLIGCTLRDLLDQRGPGRPEEVADFLLQAGSALGAAHRAGLVHRDLKPENFFVETRSDPWRHVILDFGLAKPLEADTGMTQTGMVLGTPNYMAPEQLLGRTVDARSDLYALAAIAFEVLTGRRLVRASTLAEVAFEVTREAPPALREVLPEASAAAEEAFFAALAKAPDMRPADAEGWSRALSVLLAPMPSRLPGWRGLPSGKESLPPGNSGLPTVDLPRA